MAAGQRIGLPQDPLRPRHAIGIIGEQRNQIRDRRRSPRLFPPEPECGIAAACRAPGAQLSNVLTDVRGDPFGQPLFGRTVRRQLIHNRDRQERYCYDGDLEPEHKPYSARLRS